MKKIFLIITIGLLFISTSGIALGKNTTKDMPLQRYNAVTKYPEITKYEQKLNKLDNKMRDYEIRITSTELPKQTNLDKKTASLQHRASEEITRRIKSLTNIINRIQKIKKLNDSQKAALTGNIQTEINKLNTLNTKIQNETDLLTLREDVKSIVTAYRIYLLFMPVSHIIIAADGITNNTDKLNQLAVKLQTRIMEMENNEVKHSLETTLAEMQAKIIDAGTMADNAINAVNPLQPTDYPGNKQYLQNARQMLQTALKDIQIARQDAQKIIVALRKNTPSISQPAQPIQAQKTENENNSAIILEDDAPPVQAPDTYKAL